MQNITLAILAGGNASRLGGVNKALIKVDGIPIITRIYNTFQQSVSEIIVISNKFKRYPIHAEVFPDIIPNCGPLGGIHSALAHSKNSTCFIISADMPFPNLNIFLDLLKAHFSVNTEISIPKHGRFIEPLFGIYNFSILNTIESILSDGKGHKVAELYRYTKTNFVELPENKETQMSFFNINTPDDISALEL